MGLGDNAAPMEGDALLAEKKLAAKKCAQSSLLLHVFLSGKTCKSYTKRNITFADKANGKVGCRLNSFVCTKLAWPGVAWRAVCPGFVTNNQPLPAQEHGHGYFEYCPS